MPRQSLEALLLAIFSWAWTATAEFDGLTFGGLLSHPVEQVAGCTRLFHSSGSVGCRSDEQSGLKLPLLLILPRDFPSLVGLRNADTKVAAVVSGVLFNASTLEQLRATGKVGGVLVLEDADKPDLDAKDACFSHDVNTPQGDGTPSSRLSLDGSYPWNPRGNGLMKGDLSIPIALVGRSESEPMRNRAARNRQHGVNFRPAYFAHMWYYFGGAGVDSASCLRWLDRDGSTAPKCLPLGGQSVWGTFGSRDSRPVVMATAGMDAASLFQDATYGANEAAGSIITLLAAADALSRVHSALSAAPKQVALALFQAETYGFVGSRRFVADIGGDFACSNAVPRDRNGGTALCLDPLYPSLAFTGLSLASIDALLVVDQVALDPSAALVVHATGDDSTASAAVLAATDASTGKVLAATSASLPPTPLTSFLSRRPGLSGAVISGYDTSFADPAYHSNYDDTIEASAVARAASLLARSLFRLAMDSEDASLVGVEVDTELVADLVACFTSQGLACAEVAPFVEDEAAAISVEAGAILEVPWGSSPPSFYTSVLSPAAGQPLFVRDGVSYSRFAGAWKDSDRVFVYPTALEMFLRSFLTSRLSGPADTRVSCSAAADCASFCGQFAALPAECALGKCACPVAFYHTALDPGLEPEGSPGLFAVVDPTAPNYAEPNWVSIGVTTFEMAGPGAELWCLAAGIAVAVSSVAVSLFLAKKVEGVRV